MDLAALTSLIDAYQPARAVLTAVELDLFTLLDERPRTVAELGAAAGASERGMAALVDALVALGLVERRAGGAIAAGEDAAALLSRRRATWRGGVGLRAVDRWRRFSALTESVRGGRPPAIAREPQDVLATTLAEHHAKLDRADAIAAALPLEGRKRVLDVAGGAGTLAAALLRRDPAASATIVDRALVLDVARRALPKEWVKDGRVKLKAADLLEEPLPAGFDLALLSQVVTFFEPAEVRRVLERARDALVEGGAIAVRDAWRDDRSTGAAMRGLARLVDSAAGRVYARDEIEALVAGTGFEALSWIEVPGDAGHATLVARRPLTRGATR